MNLSAPLVLSIQKIRRRINGVPLKRGSSIGAFSLVEVTLAIGIVSFGLLSVTGLLPVALKTVKDSSAQVSIANIALQVRAEIVQTPFSSNLDGAAFFYDQEGTKTNVDKSYYGATLAVSTPSLPGVDSTSYASNAKSVTVTVRYPQGVPAAAQRTNVFSILAAKQSAGS
ncbi:hypothetical protein BH09VER1_BH09VER1_13300 [soil metagenome]